VPSAATEPVCSTRTSRPSPWVSHTAASDWAADCAPGPGSAFKAASANWASPLASRCSLQSRACQRGTARSNLVGSTSWASKRAVMERVRGGPALDHRDGRARHARQLIEGAGADIARRLRSDRPRAFKPGSGQRVACAQRRLRSRTSAPGRTRTCDPRLRRPPLYPAELPGQRVKGRSAAGHVIARRPRRSKSRRRRRTRPRRRRPRSGP
jgi:hypothetical protein